MPGLHQVILFGSRARGDADPDSDYDVAVVTERPVSPEERDLISECAWKAGFEKGLVVVPLVFSLDEWERGLESHSLIVKAVKQEGIVI